MNTDGQPGYGLERGTGQECTFFLPKVWTEAILEDGGEVSERGESGPASVTTVRTRGREEGRLARRVERARAASEEGAEPGVVRCQCHRRSRQVPSCLLVLLQRRTTDGEALARCRGQRAPA